VVASKRLASGPAHATVVDCGRVVAPTRGRRCGAVQSMASSMGRGGPPPRLEASARQGHVRVTLSAAQRRRQHRVVMVGSRRLRPSVGCGATRWSTRHRRERVLFIGTPFSNLYTLVHTSAIGRVVVCLVFVIACKYALGHSEFSQSLNLLLIMPPLTLYLSHFASCLPSL
jgi:hypothetical protein